MEPTPRSPFARPLLLAAALTACAEDPPLLPPDDAATVDVQVADDQGTPVIDAPVGQDVPAQDRIAPPADTGLPPRDIVTPPIDLPPGTDVPPPIDTGVRDAGTPPMDTGARDAGTPPVDTGPRDTGPPPVDTGPRDSGSTPVDTGPRDSGTTPVDTGTPDAGTPPTAGVAVTTFQFDRARSGANRSETRLTPTAVRAGFARVTTFAPTLDGEVYAQPLYLPGVTVGGTRRDLLFVATQSNSMYALDALTGATVWRTALGTPANRSMQSCGNIGGNIGVVGTGAIDVATGTLYAVAFTDTGGLQFRLNALDVATGAQRAGYPSNINPPAVGSSSFDARVTGERGALQFVNGRVFVPFGGLYGDCGTYHGWVVGIDAANPTRQVSFATAGRGSGIWAVGGPSMDDAGNLFVATGNGFTTGSMGERVIRLGGGAAGPTSTTGTDAYFQPTDANSLDNQDLDIGSIAPLLLPSVGGARLLWQGGKAGVAYLLNRDNLGGAGSGVASARLFSGGNYGAGATWSNGSETYAFVPGRGTRTGCSGSGGVMALRITATGMTTAWCSATITNPSPPAVSSNGNADGILWVTGPTTLRAIEIATGVELFSGAPPSVRQWTPIVVADGRVYVTGTSTVSMFTTR